VRADDRIRQAAESARFRANAEPGKVDVFAAIRALEMRLLRYPLPQQSLEGAYVRRRGQAFILVNSSFPLTRQRFTAAHELGHAFLKPGEEIAHYDATLSDPEDVEANKFASQFLMDEEAVREVTDEESDSTRMALLVMHAFDVSLEAAAIRLCDLRIITGAQKEQVRSLSRDEDVSLAKLSKQYRLPRPASSRPDAVLDLGEEYEESLKALVAAGLIPVERESEFVFDDHDLGF